MQYINKRDVVLAIGFADFLMHGRMTTGDVSVHYPESFRYKGHPVSHEQDDSYLVYNPSGGSPARFNNDSILCIQADGRAVCYKCSDFESDFVPINTY